MASPWRFFGSATRKAALTPQASFSAQNTLRAARLSTPVGNDWQVTDLYQRAEQDPGVVFTDADIDETATEMLGNRYRVEEPDEGQSANAVMRAAEAQMTNNPLTELMPVIRSMLKDVNIQRAAIAHLKDSEHFQRYLLSASAANQTSAPLALEWYPDSPDTNQPADMKSLIDELGTKLVAAGEAALKTAVGVRNALGRLLIHLGLNLHAFLGKPFSKTPLEESMNAEEVEGSAEVVGQALITVAIAILSIVFLKRVHLVTAL